MDREQMILDNMKLVKFTIKKYYHTARGCFDDFLQEGYVGLIKAVDAYDPNQGEFSTFAIMCIRRSITNYCRDKKNVVRVPSVKHAEGMRIYPCSLDAKTEERDPLINFLCGGNAETEAVSMIRVKEIEGYLSQRQLHIVSMLLAGQCQREIATELGVSAGTVNSLIKTLRRTIIRKEKHGARIQ